ncbi:hypothetical protein [Kordiimonas aquimaris]|uniref:hypothetical protein n=1 Tax=Kordiimonas aquimaris TaxID=707591 RepID=UPI0021CF5F26|nr:hypothetical protein [Kordiimonas aquimaris]
MKALQLIVGKTARDRIVEHGLTPDLIRLIVGASGGPKWLILKGLDRFLCHDFLPQAKQKIDLVGSSIGAWRMTVYAHPDTGVTFDKFLESYFSFRTETLKTTADLTRASYDILNELYPAGEARRLIDNPQRNLNIVAVRGKGVAGSKKQMLEAAGIVAAAGANRLSRDRLDKFFERVVFHSGEGAACPDVWQDFSRKDVKLTPEILADTLMASGSIPFVSEPLMDIAGAGPGVYRDGGVIDYHFDVPWSYSDGIVLYPHFYDYIVPGWFDKSRPGRRATGKVWDQMLMLSPSPELVASLPGGKITDRTDFTSMNDDARLAYWQCVVDESERMAEEFAELLDDHGKLVDSLQSARVEI